MELRPFKDKLFSCNYEVFEVVEVYILFLVKLLTVCGDLFRNFCLSVVAFELGCRSRLGCIKGFLVSLNVFFSPIEIIGSAFEVLTTGIIKLFLQRNWV